MPGERRNTRKDRDANGNENEAIAQAEEKRFAIAKGFARCAFRMHGELSRLFAAFQQKSRFRADTAPPASAVSLSTSAPNQAKPPAHRLRPRNDPFKLSVQLLESLIREGHVPSHLQAARFVVAALQQNLLQILGEAYEEVMLFRQAPKDAEALSRFWVNQVVNPLMRRFPARFMPDPDDLPIHNDDSDKTDKSSDHPDLPPSMEDVQVEEPDGFYLKYYGHPGDPRNKYVVWPRACELLAELIEKPLSDALPRKVVSRRLGRRSRSRSPSKKKHRDKLLPRLEVDVEAHQARYGTKILQITALQHFKALFELWSALGRVVTHSQLHRAIKPDESRPGNQRSETLTAASQEERDAVLEINRALREVSAPYSIEAVKKNGYKLVQTTKNLTSHDVPTTSY